MEKKTQTIYLMENLSDKYGSQNPKHWCISSKEARFPHKGKKKGQRNSYVDHT